MTEAKDVEFLSPESYPQMLGRQDAARALASLRSPETAVRAAQVFVDHEPALRVAMRGYAAALEKAGDDNAQAFAIIHDVRGLAESAGLTWTGRICETLGRYREEMERAGRPDDPKVIALHVGAIIHAMRGETDDGGLSETVAAELSALVNWKLSQATGAG